MLLPSRGDEAAAAAPVIEGGLLGEALLASETVAMSAGDSGKLPVVEAEAPPLLCAGGSEEEPVGSCPEAAARACRSRSDNDVAGPASDGPSSAAGSRLHRFKVGGEGGAPEEQTGALIPRGEGG